MTKYELSPILKICLVVTILFIAAILISCASSGITLFKLVPTEGKVSTTSIHDDLIVFSGRYLDTGEQVQYLREKGYRVLGDGLRQVSLVTFILTVDNGSDLELIFDPASTRLDVGLGPLLRPSNYTHLYLELPSKSDRPRILKDLRKAIFEISTTFKPGEKKEKLLMFPRPEKVGPAAVILFQRLYVGGEETEAVLDFTVVDLGK